MSPDQLYMSNINKMLAGENLQLSHQNGIFQKLQAWHILFFTHVLKGLLSILSRAIMLAGSSSTCSATLIESRCPLCLLLVIQEVSARAEVLSRRIRLGRCVTQLVSSKSELELWRYPQSDIPCAFYWSSRKCKLELWCYPQAFAWAVVRHQWYPGSASSSCGAIPKQISPCRLCWSYRKCELELWYYPQAFGWAIG